MKLGNEGARSAGIRNASGNKQPYWQCKPYLWADFAFSFSVSQMLRQ